MSDTAISPGVGSIVATGNAPSMGFTIPVPVGAIVVTGQTLGNSYMWTEVADADTTWTIVP